MRDPDITRPTEAWKFIQEAAREGKFVPVLGPELAVDPMYTNAPPTALQEYGQDERPGEQDLELGIIGHHQRRLVKRIRNLDRPQGPPGGRDGYIQKARLAGDLSPVAYWPELPSVAEGSGKPHRETLARYIEKLSWPGAPEGPAYDKNEWTPEDPVYEDFLCDVALLAVTLKEAWNVWLRYDPRPLSSLRPDTVLGDRGQLDDREVWIPLAAGLESCRLLLERARAKAWEEPIGLRLEWIYSKLLLLGSQVFGADPDLLWGRALSWIGVPGGDFASRHILMIRAKKESQTGWQMGKPIPRAVSAAHGFRFGLRLTHVLWAENLFRHLLLAGTRAYRTLGQLAFLLSLDDEVIDLPDMSVDPFEVGLLRTLGNDANKQDLKELQRVYRFVEMAATPGGLPMRRPGAFHQAIARIMREMLTAGTEAALTGGERRMRTDAAATGPKAKKALILTMALDTEMERALELHFESYRVLVPIFLPLKTQGEREATWEPTWVLGEFALEQGQTDGRRTFSCLGWTRVTERDDDLQIKADVAGNGPLLIKLFGSPLTDVGTSESYASTSGDIDEKRRVRHRVVLDESALLRLLNDSIPSAVRGLEAKVGRSRLFFFGQNAVTWSDRIPYLMVDALRDAALDRETGLDPKLVAFAERSEYGDSLFDRLKVRRNSDPATVSSVAREIMEGIVNQGLAKDSDESI